MKERDDEMWRRIGAACVAFVPALPRRKHWWSLPRVAVTTAEIMAPLDEQIQAIFRQYGKAGDSAGEK